MTKQEKLNLLEELLDIEQGALSEDTELAQLEQWDSIAVISLIAMFDDVFEKTVLPSEVKQFRTIGDILDKME